MGRFFSIMFILAALGFGIPTGSNLYDAFMLESHFSDEAGDHYRKTQFSSGISRGHVAGYNAMQGEIQRVKDEEQTDEMELAVCEAALFLGLWMFKGKKREQVQGFDGNVRVHGDRNVPIPAGARETARV